MSRADRLELYHDAENKWRWRFKSNGRILADSGQGYVRRVDCLAGADLVFGAALRNNGGVLMCYVPAPQDAP